jgi:hypothetical protein
MTDELTPAQKAAKTRAANKAKAAEAAAAIDKAADAIDAFSESDELVELVGTEVTSKIPSKIRGWIYVAGVVLGLVATAIPSIAALTEGDPRLLLDSLPGLLLAMTNALARLNLSKPIDAARIEVLG